VALLSAKRGRLGRVVLVYPGNSVLAASVCFVPTLSIGHSIGFKKVGPLVVVVQTGLLGHEDKASLLHRLDDGILVDIPAILGFLVPRVWKLETAMFSGKGLKLVLDAWRRRSAPEQGRVQRQRDVI
jgi:hypothetical protein